jgi:hypothetical protein
MDASEHDDVGRTVVPSDMVRVTGEIARIAGPHHASTHDPSIELIRRGDEIQAIEVQCSCGKRIRLRCVYQ